MKRITKITLLISVLLLAVILIFTVVYTGITDRDIQNAGIYTNETTTTAVEQAAPDALPVVTHETTSADTFEMITDVEETVLADDSVNEELTDLHDNVSDEFISDTAQSTPENQSTQAPTFTSRIIEPGDEVYNRIYGKSYVDNPDIALSDLRYLTISYYDFNHEIQTGELIVNKSIEDITLDIFKELFDYEYEINSMRLIDDYWTGDGADSDTASCVANNSSAFCYRVITGGKSLSNHAYGCAIDINPIQNPYVRYKSGTPVWNDPNASDFIDRSGDDPHMIKEGDICYNAFVSRGFKWGGAWSSVKDYQHFEMP